MAKMTKKDLEAFKKIIEGEKDKLIEKLGFLRETAMDSTVKDASGDHSSYSFHMADQGTDSQEREKAFLFASRESQYLERLDLALRRIQEETYGICVKCENMIDKKRLKAVPIATMCFDCKTQGK
ncbi:TraR/DksA family transcriptional regulator [candidate division KSB1 bacterium]